MKRLLGFAAAGALIAFGAPGAALAVPITSTDATALSQLCLSDSAPTACSASGGALSGSSHSFTLDVTDSGFVPGNTIISAKLVLSLSDDGGSQDGNEKIALTLGGTPVAYSQNANHEAVISLTDFTLLVDGTLTVVLGVDSGDFFFDGAELTIVHEPPASTVDVPSSEQAAVPAPAALVLLGLGLVGAAWRRYTGR